MRPLKLTMQAFGPYAGTERIDFTMLGSRTMFVISGKTGAGKTTIFDGISFAIYGKASGEDRNGPDLRSQFAKDENLTEVSLEFTLRNKTYFISRSPQQEKKKERGGGYTTVGAKAELYVFDENGNKQLLAANVRDVDEKIKEIMIIDSNQFRQILMIPQGEFRKLLTSESKDKEVILQRLFHTQLYKRIEEKLKEDAAELKRTVEKQLASRNQAIQQIHPVFNEELKGYLESEGVNDTIIMPLLQTEISLMIAELEKVTNKLKEKQEQRDGLQQKLYEAEAIVKQLKAKDDLSLRKAELEGKKEQFVQIEKQIDLSQKAALLAQQEELCHHLKKELDSANHALGSLRANSATLADRLKEQETAWENEKNRENERKATGEQISRLQNMKEDIYSFAMVEKEVLTKERELQSKNIQKNQIEESLEKTEQNIQSLLDEKQRIERDQLIFVENAHKLEKIDKEIERLNKYEEQSSRYDKARIHLDERKGYFENSIARLADAKITVEQLEQNWLHGQASILANKLKDGDACPVCGSEHHPMPAISMDAIPDEKDLKAAKQQMAAIEKEKAAAESAFYEAQSTVLHLSEAVEELIQEIQQHRPDLTPENLPIIKRTILSERNELANIQGELENRKKRHGVCLKELESAEKDKENHSVHLKGIVKQINEATILYTEQKTNLTRMMEHIPEEIRAVDIFEKRLQHAVNKQEELLKRLEAAQQSYQHTKGKYLTETAKCETIEKQAEKLSEQLSSEREAFVLRMKKQGFETYGEYNEAKKTEQEVRLKEKSLRDYREEIRSVSDRFEELSQLLKDIDEPDLDKLSHSFKEVEGQISLLQTEYTNLFIKKRDNEETAKNITNINKEIKALEERYKVIGDLYEIAKGQNTYRITFERFVLAAFLDDILREANGRLSKMTGGRYELLRKTDRSKGNAQSGLELLVFDQYTGQERHVKTLSGGESFKAALALALGLADVVQQYAGGVSLETMFIDEGFGTLDPESLDQAIEALIDIQSSGRLVGIISHVPELKERIDARLEVIATQTGSMTEFQFLT
ncbi:SMC family ATPase [Bacillus sp. FJAT-29790]|uniref:AAA family ATPase n=1 Tax=Bacillus sp. FJAT-29790 TaxID=1895002 RepID=UPI001C226DD7|nr:SMC family ATPase [Bacillus sp. FJAT-29790]MBU8878718.1 SMC family ATPase [Bacillus sp. FJAT-29790]